MGLTSLISEIGSTLLQSEGASSLGTEVFKKDIEILGGIEELKPLELTESIVEHLVKEGHPGSAEFMTVFSKSAMLDKELSLMGSDSFDISKIEHGGLQVMIDPQSTTMEMVKLGQAVLTPETRADFLGSINTLKYKLDQHISKTAQKASEYYSKELTRQQGISESLKGLLGVKPEPYELAFTPNRTEMEKLYELSRLKYTSREEAQQTFQKELNLMMRQRPGSIGLTTTFSMSKFLGEVSQNLGGNIEGVVETDRLRNLHFYMKGQCMGELLICPEFGKAVEDRIERCI